jgi:hypothetical protein
MSFTEAGQSVPSGVDFALNQTVAGLSRERADLFTLLQRSAWSRVG